MQPDRAKEQERFGRIRVGAWPAYSTRHKNPYTWQLYEAVLQQSGKEIVPEEVSVLGLLTSRYDIWHLHWPEATLGSEYATVNIARLLAFCGLVWWARAVGCRVVWTIHNLEPHEGRHRRIQAWLRRFLVNRLDGAISLTATAQEVACKRWPRLERCARAIIPHGHYIDSYPNTIDREAARRRLNVAAECRVAAFVGGVREYKNVLGLIKAFRGVQDKAARLIIAGQVDGRLDRDLEREAAADSRIVFHPGFVADTDLQTYLNASDLVVLPFKEVLNSGSVLLALSFGCPVLVPKDGSLPELRARLGEHCIRMYEGSLESAVLERELASVTSTFSQKELILQRLRDALSWEEIALLTIRFYEQVLKSSGNRRQREKSGAAESF
jgi:beta-1,4-mannosyltransferase